MYAELVGDYKKQGIKSPCDNILNYENDAALGLSCTETTRNAAANKLYGKSFKDLSESQKQLTLLQMVEDANKASGAMGQAARESDTWTNVTGNLKQAWTDLQAALGSAVLPGVVNILKGLVTVVEGVTNATKSAVEWFDKHKVIAGLLGTAVGTLTAAITAYTIAEKLKKIAVAAGVATEATATAAMGAHTIATNIATAATTAFGAVMSFITSPITLVVAAIGAVIAIVTLLVKNWDTVSAAAGKCWDWIKGIWGKVAEWFDTNVIQPVVNFFKGLWDSIKNIWDQICNVVQVAVMAIGQILNAAFQIITLPFRFIWENCKDIVLAAWDWIKDKVSTAINAVKDKITGAWNAIKSVTSTVWNAVKGVVLSVWNGIKSVVTNAINNVKSKVTGAWNAVKSVTSTVWNAVKGVVSSVWNGIKTAISNAINNVKTKVSDTWNNIKSKTSNVFNGIKSTASKVWNSIKDAITKPIEKARDKVKEMIDKIKSFFNFKWSLPKLKMPHFKISGKFSLNPPSVPKFSVEWYKKAMQNAMVLTNPTIFGYSAASGKYLGGGEAGNEVVAGESHLMNMIRNAVAAENEAVAYYLQKLIEMLASYFPQMLEAMDNPRPAVLGDPNHVANQLAVPMNNALGKLSTRKDRGR